MRRATRLAVALFAATIAMATGEHRAFSCQCRQIPLRELFQGSPAVFIARILRVERTAETGYESLLATAIVVRSWRGVGTGQTVTIASPRNDCGYDFTTRYFDSLHVIVARRDWGRPWLRTDACSGSKPLGMAGSDVDSMDRWRAAGVLDTTCAKVVVEVRDARTGSRIDHAFAEARSHPGSEIHAWGQTDIAGRTEIECMPEGVAHIRVGHSGYVSTDSVWTTRRVATDTLRFELNWGP